MVGATAGPRQPVRMTAWAACLALVLAAVQASVAELHGMIKTMFWAFGAFIGAATVFFAAGKSLGWF